MTVWPSSTVRRARRPNLRLACVLWLTITSAGCALPLKQEPVVVVRYVDRVCPEPLKVDLLQPPPPGLFMNRLLEILSTSP